MQSFPARHLNALRRSRAGSLRVPVGFFFVFVITGKRPVRGTHDPVRHGNSNRLKKPEKWLSMQADTQKRQRIAHTGKTASQVKATGGLINWLCKKERRRRYFRRSTGVFNRVAQKRASDAKSLKIFGNSQTPQ